MMLRNIYLSVVTSKKSCIAHDLLASQKMMQMVPRLGSGERDNRVKPDAETISHFNVKQWKAEATFTRGHSTQKFLSSTGCLLGRQGCAFRWI